MKVKVNALADSDKSELSRLEPLILDFRFKPYQEYGIPQNRLANYLTREIQQAMSSKNGLVLTAEEDGQLVGLISAKKLVWDTRHFGIEMAKIEHLVAEGEYDKSCSIKSMLLSSFLRESTRKRFQHLSTFVHTEDISSIHVLESKGFRMMDTRVTYALDLQRDRLSEFENPCLVREFRQTDLNDLVRMAREAFKGGRIATDRFHADPYLSKKKSDELYVKWILNSCRGIADAVLVAEADGAVAGYITCKAFESTRQELGRKFGSMIISAVSPSVRQRGVYSSLFNTGLQWLAKRVDIVEVGTQIGNYLVQKVWPKFGFTLKRSQHSLAYSGTDYSTTAKEGPS